MYTTYDNSLISKDSITNIISDQEKLLDTMIQLIQTVKSLDLLSDGTISEEKRKCLRDVLNSRLNEKISELQENTGQKNQFYKENNNSNLTTSQFNELIQNRLDAIIKLVKTTELLSDKTISFDSRESLNDLLQKELNNEISELQILQEKKPNLVN